MLGTLDRGTRDAIIRGDKNLAFITKVYEPLNPAARGAECFDVFLTGAAYAVDFVFSFDSNGNSAALG